MPRVIIGIKGATRDSLASLDHAYRAPPPFLPVTEEWTVCRRWKDSLGVAALGVGVGDGQTRYYLKHSYCTRDARQTLPARSSLSFDTLKTK